MFNRILVLVLGLQLLSNSLFAVIPNNELEGPTGTSSFHFSYTGLTPQEKPLLPLSSEEFLNYKNKKALVEILKETEALKRSDNSRGSWVNWSWAGAGIISLGISSTLFALKSKGFRFFLLDTTRWVLHGEGNRQKFFSGLKELKQDKHFYLALTVLGGTWLTLNFISYTFFNTLWKHLSFQKKFNTIEGNIFLIEAYNSRNQTEKGHVIRYMMEDILKAAQTRKNTKFSLAFWRTSTYKAALEIQTHVKNLIQTL